MKFLRKKMVIVLIATVAVGVGFYGRFSQKPAPRLVTVTRGDIAEEVIVTGNTKPVQVIDLAFERGGKTVRVNVDVGDRAVAGQALVELDASELLAELKKAEASVEAARAKLDAFTRGARPEDIQITRTQLGKSQQDLANDYNGVLSTLNDAYAKSDDAARNQLSAFFTNADTITPQMTFSVTDSQIQIDAQSQRVTAGAELVAWKNELVALNASATIAPEKLDQALKNAQAHLAVILTFLNRSSDALLNSVSVSATTLTAYKTSITTARSQATTATTNVNNASQTIASQKLVVKQNNDQLNLQLAGSAVEDIRAQEAQVAQAVANVGLYQAQLGKTVLRSPINGTVTRQDAKVGEIAAANKTLVSVISADNLEIEANVPEVDIGKVVIANAVNITLDAFPGETFRGKVIKIDPAETIVDGVVNFKITIGFGKIDGRVKSGLTANLGIETIKKIGVLILPQVAIVQNDQGAFVRRYENGKTKDYPVTIGIRDQSGNVEILSGVSEGEEVVNVGLK